MFCKVLLDKNKKALKSRLIIGAGGGNRTLTISLEGWSSTIKLHLLTRKGIEPFPRMDIAGLEPTTTRL